MPITLDDVEFLVSATGQQLLAEYSTADISEQNTLPLLTNLRKTLSLEYASAILITLRLRRKAIDKFPQFAEQMLFSEDSLQQASDPRIRQYRANLIANQKVLDVCCSIGSDALAFAEAGHPVLGLDIDPVRIAMARYNAEICGVEARFEVADVTHSIPENYNFIFFDPARRTADGKRTFDVESYIPPLSLIHNFHAGEIAVKLSPAVDLRQLDAYGGQVEFISVGGDLKEAVLWKNRPQETPKATLITDTIHHFEPDGHDNVATVPPKQWLLEPDPSILRSGLVQQFASKLNATLLDETIAYLTMDDPIETLWGRYWRILDWMPFNLKKLRRYLSEHHVGQVTVKKRGFPMSPEEVITKLKLKKGDKSRVLVMTRYEGNPIVMICVET